MFKNYVDAVDAAKNDNDKALYKKAIRIGLELINNKNVYKPAKQSIESDVEMMYDVLKNWNQRSTVCTTGQIGSSEHVNSAEIPSDTWDDVIGLTNTKRDIQVSTIMCRRQPELFRSLNADAQKCILLYGPPGTGKTMIAKAIANQLQYAFFELPPSAVLDKFVGNSEKNVRAVFNAAIQSKCAVIFVDELDALVPKRTDSDSSQSRNGLVTEFLQCVDAIKKYEDIFFVSATNHYDMIDPAFLRRFMLRICVPLPTTEARKHMIQTFFADANKHCYLTETDDINMLVDLTKCFNVSDIQNCVLEAKMTVINQAMSLGRWRRVNDKYISDPMGEAIDAKDIPHGAMVTREPNMSDLLDAIMKTRPTAKMDEVNKIYEAAGVDLRDRD